MSLIDREKLRARVMAGYTQQLQTQEWHDAVGWALALIDAAPPAPSALTVERERDEYEAEIVEAARLLDIGEVQRARTVLRAALTETEPRP